MLELLVGGSLVVGPEMQASCCGTEVGPQPAAEQEGSVTHWRCAFVASCTERHCSHLGQSAVPVHIHVLGLRGADIHTQSHFAFR